MSDRDYYCSMKFRFLKIDFNTGITYNCHVSAGHKINYNALKEKPGSLFNSDVNVKERYMMLDNIRNSSCEQNCWYAEDRGAISPRIYQNGMPRTHLDPLQQPETIDLTINNNCNLTCTYCCKEYSSSWNRDIVENGDYPVSEDRYYLTSGSVSDSRYRLTSKDKALIKLKQNDLISSANYNLLLDEFSLISENLKDLVITGGEPFLNNALIDVLSKIKSKPNIKIYTGLGVNSARFEKYLIELKRFDKINLIVSAEATDKFFEFNRYGVSWDQFNERVELIKKHNINFTFHSTLSNLTVFDFANFFKYYSNDTVKLTFAYSPRIMSPFVMDSDSKQLVEQSLQLLPDDFKSTILKSINAIPSDPDRQNLKLFLSEFVRRRPDLNLNIYPDSFLKWLGL